MSEDKPAPEEKPATEPPSTPPPDASPFVKPALDIVKRSEDPPGVKERDDGR
jgi:hypothetical protein